MREHRKTVCLTLSTLLLLLLVPIYQAQGQNYYEYNVQINSDGSAVWTITQFSGTNASVDTWAGFQDKIFTIVDQAATATHRSMAIDENSIQINTTISAESKITEYSFVWLSFSVASGSEIRFGDAFAVNNFFGQLYGNAALQVGYPSDFSVKSVSPTPYERQDLASTMKWSRTEDLTGNKVNVVLTNNLPSSSSLASWQSIAAIVGVSAATAVSLLFGFYAYGRKKATGNAMAVLEPAAIETEEDKVLKVLKVSGGSMRQSDIVEQCRFSKAKTSQLLAALENRGIITRYKKGRDKIVSLKEAGEEKP